MSLTIIGFGKVTVKDLGETGLEQQCAWCSERVFYRLVLERTWFTYFFIPIYAYRKEHRVECPRCASGIAIRGTEVEAALKGELMLRSE